MSTDELIQDMTRKEAQSLNTVIRNSETRKRLGIYLIHRRNGWKALGFKSFDDYCEESIDTPRRTAYDWIEQVQQTADARGFTLSDLCTMCTNEKAELLPTTITREMKKLPSPEIRRNAWQKIEALVEHGTRSPREINISLKNLVKQMLKQADAAPVVAPGLPEPSPMPAPSAFDKAQESKTPTQTPTPTAQPEKPKPATVRGFTPDVDADPEPELFQIDFKEAEEVLQTLLTWVQNEAIDGDAATKKWAIGSLCELSQWVEASL